MVSRVSALVGLLALAAPSAAVAQLATGNIYGAVSDASGSRLPGATITLSGPFTRSTVTDAHGRFRFLRVDAERYRLTVSMPGFTTAQQSLGVTTGRDVRLDYRLEVAALREDVTVLGVAPVVDAKRVGTRTTIVKDEAVRTPNARDVWAVLRTVPGVVTASTSVAGEQSGQQVAFTGKGASPDDSTWSLDGVPVDDLSSGGATPFYATFEYFDEVAVTTGGNGVDIQTGGVGLNFVTRRGTNEWHGSVRGYLTHDDLQWSNLSGTGLEEDPRLQLPDGSFARNAFHIEQINDYGFDLGGPLIRDRLFVYGLYDRQDIRHRQIEQTRSKTVLESLSAKLNWQVSPGTSASLFWFDGTRTQRNRNQVPGFAAEDAALLDAVPAYEGFLPFGIQGMLKLEVSHSAGPSLVLNGSYTNFDKGLSLVPRGSGPSTLDILNAELRGNGPFDGTLTLPIRHVTHVDGSWFFSGWGGGHELKFGFGYKRAPVSSSFSTGGRDTGLAGLVLPRLDSEGRPITTVDVYRPAAVRWEATHVQAFASDTFTSDRVTATLGLRFDHQRGENSPSTIPASPSFPELLPSVEYPGGGVGVRWNDLSPRLGVTYALDGERRTIVRGSFALYAGKLNAAWATSDNPAEESFLSYLWDDRNRDGLPQPDEVDLDSGLLSYGGVNPADPAALESPDTIDPAFEAPRDYEAVLGIEREILPDLAASAAYTWRRSAGIPWRRRIGLTSEDYAPNPPVTANGFTGQTFSPDPALVAASGGGWVRTNRADYHRTYDGLELTLHKRLSRGWMARAAFAWMDWREYFDGPAALQNPTRTLDSPGVDGGPVALNGRSLKGVFNSYTAIRWQLAANALVELPAGFEVAASLFGRQGHAQPIFVFTGAGADGAMGALATENVDDRRYPDLWHLDLRVGRRQRLGRANLTLEATVFNVFNSRTALNRVQNGNSNRFLRLDGVLNPRVVRLGVRLTF